MRNNYNVERSLNFENKYIYMCLFLCLDIYFYFYSIILKYLYWILVVYLEVKLLERMFECNFLSLRKIFFF